MEPPAEYSATVGDDELNQYAEQIHYVSMPGRERRRPTVEEEELHAMDMWKVRYLNQPQMGMTEGEESPESYAPDHMPDDVWDEHNEIGYTWSEDVWPFGGQVGDINEAFRDREHYFHIHEENMPPDMNVIGYALQRRRARPRYRRYRRY